MFKVLAVLLVFGTILFVESGETVNGFIAGGADAVPGQFPYLVSLRRADDLNFCGGAILNTRWILTAAVSFIVLYSYFGICLFLFSSSIVSSRQML